MYDSLLYLVDIATSTLHLKSWILGRRLLGTRAVPSEVGRLKGESEIRDCNVNPYKKKQSKEKIGFLSTNLSRICFSPTSILTQRDLNKQSFCGFKAVVLRLSPFSMLNYGAC